MLLIFDQKTGELRWKDYVVGMILFLFIWRTVGDKSDSKNPLIIVECKSDNVTIKADD
jgi:hypothetical protein